MSELHEEPVRPLIWVVDDSATEAAITECALGDSYRYERFADGSIVVERLSRGAAMPDLILCDWVMPGMSGDDVCRFLRAQPLTSDLPIIIVTASRLETGDVVHGLAVGANDYVPRPFAPEELRARVDAALRAKSLKESSKRERQRLDAINRLTSGLLRSGSRVETVLERLADALTAELCDGCAVMLLPGKHNAAPIARHRHDPTAATLAGIGALADPGIHAFATSAEARATLPPLYHPYIDRFGLRALAILPFPMRLPLEGVVTLTRDEGAPPFDSYDVVTIETAIEYAGLAVETGLRHDAERVGRAQLDAVLSNLPIGVMATDDRGVLTLVNAAAVELLPGIESAQHLSEVYALARWADPTGAEEITEASWPIARAVHGAIATRAELLVTPHGDQTSRIVAVSGLPLYGGLNQVVGSVAMLQDVSAERAIAAERDRVARFQQDMLAIVGHDLRSPLGAIMVATELLTEKNRDPGAERLLERIGTSTRRIATMVDQLLDITRTRLGGGLPIERRPLELRQLVVGVVEEVALSHPRIRFSVVGADAVHGAWDAERLQQVVTNLVSNAAQYGPTDGVVTIALELVEPDAVSLKVKNQIRDFPIPTEALAGLFDPYRRGSADGNRSGLGLGLYIVHEIVRAHGGRITAASSPAIGTVFEAVLPRHATDAVTTSPAPVTATASP